MYEEQGRKNMYKQRQRYYVWSPFIYAANIYTHMNLVKAEASSSLAWIIAKPNETN